MPQLPIRYAVNLANNIRDVANNIGPLAFNTISKQTLCSGYNFGNLGASSVYAPGKALPPSWQIFACQIPMQVAQLIDGQRRSTRAESFRYPVLPDMCVQAQCVGQPGCQIENDLWSTLSNTNFQKAQYTPTVYQQQATANSKYAELQQLNTKYTENGRATTTPGLIAGSDFGLSTTDIPRFKELLGYPPNTPLDPVTVKAYMNIATETYTKGQSDAIDQTTKQIGDRNNIPLNPAYLDAHYANNIQRVDLLQDSIKYTIANPTPPTKADTNKDGTLKYTTQNAYDTALAEYKVKTELNPHALLYSLQDSGICPDAASCQNYWNDAVSGKNGKSLPGLQAQLDAQKQVYQSEQEKYEQIADAEQFGQIANIALNILYANHVLDFMSSDHWGMQWFNSAIKYFDTEQWKQSICNPDVSVIGIGSSTDESVIAYQYGACQPALTYAAERVQLTRANTTSANSTYYIYTVVYYIGPLFLDRPTDTLGYRVEFRGYHITAKGFKDVQILHDNEAKQYQRAFANVNKFDTICIIFDQEYPPRTIGAKKEYCRPIKENVFNTGNPAVDIGIAAPSQQTASTLGVDIYNVQTRIGQNNNEPGVLE